MSEKFLVFDDTNVEPLALSEDDFDENGEVKESVVMDYFYKNQEELDQCWEEGWDCGDSAPEYTVDEDYLTKVITMNLNYSVIVESEF